MIRFISFCASSMRPALYTVADVWQKSAGLAVFLDKLCDLEDHRSEQREGRSIAVEWPARQVSLAPLISSAFTQGLRSGACPWHRN